jgi:hypothetical protein
MNTDIENVLIDYVENQDDSLIHNAQHWLTTTLYEIERTVDTKKEKKNGDKTEYEEKSDSEKEAERKKLYDEKFSKKRIRKGVGKNNEKGN